MDSPPKRPRVDDTVGGDNTARSSSDLPPGFAMAAPVPAPVDPLDDPEYQGCLERELEALMEDDDMDVLLQVQDELMIDRKWAEYGFGEYGFKHRTQ